MAGSAGNGASILAIGTRPDPEPERRPTTVQVGSVSVALPAGGVAIIAALMYASLSQGAYYRGPFLVTAALLVGGLAWSLAIRRPEPSELTNAATAAAGCLALVAIVSGMVNGQTVGGMTAATALLAMVAMVVVARRATPRGRSVLASGALVIGVVIALSGWLGVALDRAPLTLVDGGLRRAASTLTYANATSAMLSALALVAAGRLTDRPPDKGRALDGLALMALVLGVLATLSRAGLAGLGLGTVVLSLLSGWRAMLRACWPATAGAAAAFVGLLPSVNASGPTRPLSAVIALAAGILLTLWGSPSDPRPRRALLALGVAASASLLVVVGTGALGPILDDRLTASSPDRNSEWRETWALVQQEPVLGAGPGPFAIAWEEEGETRIALYTHNEYLQLAAQQGLVGLAVALTGLASVGYWLMRARPPVSAGLWSGALAGLAALALHSAFDFIWHVPVIPLVGALLAGMAAPTIHRHQWEAER